MISTSPAVDTPKVGYVPPSARGRVVGPYRASGPQGPETLAGVHDGVGRVGQHLLDDLATQPGIAAALDLDRRRHTVLTYDHVVNRPAIGAAV